MQSSSQSIEFRRPRRTAPTVPVGDAPLHSSWNDLLTEVLESQRSLSVVERFSKLHDQSHLGTAQTGYFRDLIPLSKPLPGQQYGFEVDLDQCSSCKACVTACHSLNGLGPGETWRNVGLLSSNNPELPLQKTVTTACHHCVEPGCLQGCPVLAYDKDPVTGIVRHLDDQCIGCQYCILKCPYDVPKYSSRLGIVRKCDLCSNRLAAGEAPACVQACPNEAIHVVLVDTNEVRSRFESTGFKSSEAVNPFLPDSPPPDYTFPTTRFVSRQPLPSSLRAADSHRLEPADPHNPLVFMLTLSQAATGALTAALFSPQTALLSTALALLLASMGLGATHLGHPLKAWRSFLGWRQSWLSRELLVFGAMLPVTVLAVMSTFPALSLASGMTWGATMAASVTGLVGVGCSAMLYADTRRPFWSARRTFPLFYTSTVMLGAAWAWAWTAGAPEKTGTVLPSALLLVALFKLTGWLRFARHHAESATNADTKSARLVWGPLLGWNRVLLGALVVGGVVLPLLWMAGAMKGGLAIWMSVALLTLGDGAEKVLFFRAVVPLKMPGGIAA